MTRAILFFGAVATLACAPTLIGGRSWVPSDFYANTALFGADTTVRPPLANMIHIDIIESNYHRDELLGRALQAGELPLWDPYHFFGQPMHAQAGGAPLYPVKWLLALIGDADLAYSLLLWSHLWLAGLGMYALARRLGLAATAAIVGGLVWMLCGRTTVMFKHSVYLPHLALLPWVFACAVGITWRRALAGGLLLGLAMFGGHYYLQLMSAIFLTAFLVVQRAGLKGAVLVGVGLLIFLPQLIPTAQLMRESSRLGGSPPLDLEVHPKNLALLATLAAPRILGGPVDRAHVYKELDLPEPHEFNIYVGLLPLMLAAWSIALRPRTPARFFITAGLVVFALLFFDPANSILHALIPSRAGVNRYRICTLFAFCVSVAAAVGLDRMLTEPARFRASARLLVRFTAAAILLALAASAALAWRGGSLGRWLGPANAHVHQPLLFAAGLAIVLALFTAGRRTAFSAGAVALVLAELFTYFHAYNPTYPSPLPPAVTALQADPHARVASYDTIPWWSYYLANIPPHYGVRSAGGYDDLVTARYHRWATAAGGTTMRGSQAVIFPEPHPMLAAAGVSLHLREGVATPLGGKRASLSGPGAVVFVEDGFNRVVLQVMAEENAVLTLRDSFHPDWRCTVDDAPVGIALAEELFRSVPVPKGEHRVVFTYEPRLFFLCLVASALTLACALTAIVGLTRSGKA